MKKPELGEVYFVVGLVRTGFTVNYFVWDNDEADKEFYDNQNCFKTREQAYRLLNRLKQTIEDFAKEETKNDN